MLNWNKFTDPHHYYLANNRAAVFCLIRSCEEDRAGLSNGNCLFSNFYNSSYSISCFKTNLRQQCSFARSVVPSTVLSFSSDAASNRLKPAVYLSISFSTNLEMFHIFQTFQTDITQLLKAAVQLNISSSTSSIHNTISSDTAFSTCNLSISL